MNSGEESAFPMVSSSSFRVTQVRGLRIFVAGFLLEDFFSSLRVVEVVKELRLITCGRSAHRQGCNTPHLGEGAAGVSLGVVHMEEGVQVRVQVECGREEVGDREKHGERQNEDTSNRQSTAHHGWHQDGMSTRLQTLEPWLVLSQTVSIHIIRRVQCA